MTTDVKALIGRMRFQLQREGLKSAVRGALSDGADALTALSAENERLTKERDSHARACTTATGIADHLTAETMRLQLERKRLEAERCEAERLYNAKCGEHHRALAALDRAQAALREAYEWLLKEYEAIPTSGEVVTADARPLFLQIRAALSPEPPATIPLEEGSRKGGRMPFPRNVRERPEPPAALSNPSEIPNGSAAPSPVTDEMVEVLRETLSDLGNGGVSLVHARVALTAALGRKP